MAEHITSNNDIYNREGGVGKATDIQSDDLFYLQRGTGSYRDKVIKGSDIKASTGLVIVSSYSESNPLDIPEPLRQKLYNSDTINFDDTTVSGNKKIVAELRTNSVDTAHLKSNSVTTAKIAEGAVTESKIALNSIQEQAIKNDAVTGAKLADASVSNAKLQNASVSGSKIATSVIESVHDAVEVTLYEVVDQSTNKCDVTVHQFSAVDAGGFIDVTVYIDAMQNDDYMQNVVLEIRKSGSTTAESTFNIDTPDTTSTVSRRMVVKNGTSSAANYELHLICNANFTPGGTPISGFQACNVDIRGISVA